MASMDTLPSRSQVVSSGIIAKADRAPTRVHNSVQDRFNLSKGARHPERLSMQDLLL